MNKVYGLESFPFKYCFKIEHFLFLNASGAFAEKKSNLTKNSH